MPEEYVGLFDMDGSLCDYVGTIHSDLKKLLAPNEEFVDPFLVSQDELDEYQYLWNRMDLIKASEDWWANLPPIQAGFDVLHLATQLGYTNEILTQQPETNSAAAAGKVRWILNNLEGANFTLTRNKSRYYGRFLYEDFPGYIEPWLKHRPRGLVIMPETRYNKGFEHPQLVTYTGDNLDEVREALIEAKRR